MANGDHDNAIFGMIAGWVVAGVSSLWAILVKRRAATIDRIFQRLDDIDARLASLEGRFQERDHRGRRT